MGTGRGGRGGGTRQRGPAGGPLRAGAKATGSKPRTARSAAGA
jgi:hypothetical protein